MKKIKVKTFQEQMRKLISLFALSMTMYRRTGSHFSQDHLRNAHSTLLHMEHVVQQTMAEIEALMPRINDELTK